MTEIDIKIDDRALSRHLRHMERSLPEAAHEAEKAGAEVMLEQIRGEAPERTGALKHSFAIDSTQEGTGVFSRHPGAQKIASGGVIRPKRTALAIPFSSASVPRDAAPRSQGLVVTRPRGGRALLADVSAGGFEPKYTLIDQVTVPASGYLDRAKEQAKPKIQDAALHEAKKASQPR